MISRLRIIFSLVLLIGVCFSVRTFAQSTNLNFFRAIEESRSEFLSLYVKGDNDAIKKEVEALRGEIRKGHKGYLHVLIPIDEVESFIELPFLDDVYFEYVRPTLLCDSMRAKSNIFPVHAGDSPLPHPYTGKDVVVGIIDTGIDFNHPDFIDDDGNTRVMYIWDQTVSGPDSPINYGYGQEWDSISINNGTCTHEDQPNFFGHGTNVAAVAASNGNATGTHIGSAPDANIIAVSLNFSSASWLSDVADAVEYIYSMADSMGLPCVVNISAGTYTGSHDGLDVSAQRIDSVMKAKPGRALACSAGNAGGVGKFHLGYDLTADTNITWFEHNASLNFGQYGNGVVFFEAYTDTADFRNAWFSLGADVNTSAVYNNTGSMQFLNLPGFFDGTYSAFMDAGGIFNDSIVNSSGEKLADVYIGYDLINEDATYLLQVIIDPDSSETDYSWRFETTGAGRFDVWSTSWASIGTSDMIDSIPNSTIFRDSAYYKYPDTMQSIVSSFQCLPDVITVGNYVNRNQYVDYNGDLQIVTTDPPGHLFSSSSLGPTRQGVTKPTLAAPGSTTMAASRLDDLAAMVTGNPSKLDPDGMHRTANGTSMASPGVAGIIALMFESCSSYTYEDINNALIAGAKEDQYTHQYTGSVPNNYFGYGKADALRSILSTPQNTMVVDALGLPTDDSLFVCEEEVVGLDQQFSAQTWNTGQTTALIQINASGLYFATGMGPDGCLVSSDSVYIELDPFIIPSPELNVADSSSCENVPITMATLSSYSGYLWSDGSNGSTLTTDQTGSYYVLVTDDDGCKAYSEIIDLTFLITPPAPTVSVLNDTILTSSIASTYQWYSEGSILSTDTNQVLYAQDSGYYYVEITHPNGCSAISDSVFVIIPYQTSILETGNSGGVSVYPNPTKNNVFIQFDGVHSDAEVALYNGFGQLVDKWLFNNPTIAEIGMNGFSDGIYFLYIRAGEEIQVQKVIKN